MFSNLVKDIKKCPHGNPHCKNTAINKLTWLWPYIRDKHPKDSKKYKEYDKKIDMLAYECGKALDSKNWDKVRKIIY